MNRKHYKIKELSTCLASILMILSMVLTGCAKQEKAVKIGAILSLSGANTTVGDNVRDGMLLAVDEVNSWGGVNGRPLKLFIEDSKTDSEAGKQAFLKLESEHHPHFYISVLSTVSVAVAPLAAQNEVVLAGLVVSAPRFTKGNEWVFRYYPSAEDEILPIMSLLKKFKVNKLGILFLGDEFGSSVSKLLDQKFKKNGGTVKKIGFDPGTSNFGPQIEFLRDQDAIYTVGFASYLQRIFEQMKQTDYKGFVLSNSSATWPPLRKLPEADGILVAAPVIYNPKFILAKETKNRFEIKYKKLFNHYAANGYDFIKLLSGLLEDQEISRENIRKQLDRGFTYPGIFGTLNVSPGKHDIHFPLHPARIRDGELEYMR